MRKFLLPLLAASTLTLGGDVLGGVLGSVLGGGGYGQGGYGAYGNQDFQRAAVNACGNQASRYGRVSITNVEMRSGDTLRVFGTVSDGYRGRNFACSFRADGRITDFDI